MTDQPTTHGDSADDDDTVITRPNALKTRLPGELVDVQLTMKPDLLKRAEAEIERLTTDYLDWVEDDFQKLEAAYKKLEAETDLESRAFGAIMHGAFEIASQGSAFDYQLLTEIGKSLHEFTDALVSLEPAQVLIIKLHIDSMRVVLRESIKGDGGTAGAELMTMLRKAVAKYL